MAQYGVGGLGVTMVDGYSVEHYAHSVFHPEERSHHTHHRGIKHQVTIEKQKEHATELTFRLGYQPDREAIETYYPYERRQVYDADADRYGPPYGPTYRSVRPRVNKPLITTHRYDTTYVRKYQAIKGQQDARSKAPVLQRDQDLKYATEQVLANYRLFINTIIQPLRWGNGVINPEVQVLHSARGVISKTYRVEGMGSVEFRDHDGNGKFEEIVIKKGDFGRERLIAAAGMSYIFDPNVRSADAKIRAQIEAVVDCIASGLV